MRNPVSLTRLGVLALGVVACSTNPTSPVSRTVVASVVPAGESVAVPTGSPVMVTFSNPMQPGMQTYAALHEGSVIGPVVAGTWMWSSDHTRLTFTPTMALQAHSIRIVAPIPGKAAVGVEIPNQHRATVHLREVLTAREFANEALQLPLALGKEIGGPPWWRTWRRCRICLWPGPLAAGRAYVSTR